MEIPSRVPARAPVQAGFEVKVKDVWLFVRVQQSNFRSSFISDFNADACLHFWFGFDHFEFHGNNEHQLLRNSDVVNFHFVTKKMKKTSGGWVTILEDTKETKEVLNLKEFLGTDNRPAKEVRI